MWPTFLEFRKCSVHCSLLELPRIPRASHTSLALRVRRQERLRLGGSAMEITKTGTPLGQDSDPPATIIVCVCPRSASPC